jgi:hypothetical protein
LKRFARSIVKTQPAGLEKGDRSLYFPSTGTTLSPRVTIGSSIDFRDSD